MLISIGHNRSEELIERIRERTFTVGYELKRADKSTVMLYFLGANLGRFRHGFTSGDALTKRTKITHILDYCTSKTQLNSGVLFFNGAGRKGRVDC